MSEGKIQVDGRLSKDPELKQGQKGKFCRFSLAVDNEEGGTTWYNATAFKGLGELVAANLKKGMEVRVKGRAQVREYTKADQSIGVSNDLVVDSVIMEGGIKLDKFTNPAALQAKQEAKSQEDVDPAPNNDPNGGNDEIPF